MGAEKESMMDDLHADQSDAARVRAGGLPPESVQRALLDGANSEPKPEPKPVFDGDWNSASGAEKGRHSERVRQWRKREEARVEAEAQRRMAANPEQPVSRLRPDGDAAAGDAASRRVLEEIRDDHRALASDRIRAAQQLIALDRGAAEQGAHESDLVTLRAVLETLEPHERLAWLQGERLAHAGA